MPDPITTFTASTFVSWLLKKGFDKIFDGFKNREDLESNLEDVVHKTTDEYKNDYKIPNEGKKFPFYESQEFIDELLKYQIYNKDEYKKIEVIIASVLKNNPNIIEPKKEQIDLLLEIFEKHVRNNGKLMLNAIKDDTEVLIEKTDGIDEKIDEIPDKVAKKIEDKIVKETKIPKELTSLVKIPKKEIVGREKDLAVLRESLEDKKDTALINGMGGIGKTTLAAVYISEFYDEYDHIVWLTIENTLEEAIVANSDLITNLKLEGVDPKVQFDACLNELRILESEKPSLLVLDNAHINLSEHYDKLPKKPNCHVLVTSRERIPHFNIMDLDFLTETEAINLFKKHNTNFSDDEIREIVKCVELHTLTIEILALSAKKNRWSFNQIQTALPKDAKANVKIKHSKEQIDRIKSYLTSIFDLNILENQEKYLLIQFTALPNQWIKFDFLCQLLQSEKLSWSDEFAGTLENIYEKGFILEDKKTDSYKMHPILVEALIENLETTSKDLKLLSASVSSMLHLDQTKDNPIDKFQFIPFGDALLKQLADDTSNETGLLHNQLALRYHDLGSYNKASDIMELALKLYKMNLGEKHSNVATCQSNLGEVYRNLGDYEKARNILELALKSDIKNYGKAHPEVATIQSNLGLVYQDLGEYEKARDLLESVLKSDITNFGEKHPHVASSQSNLALVFRDLGDYEKARDLLESALKSYFANFGEMHPNVATSRSNLALVYQNLGEYGKARDLLESALKSDIANFGEQHPAVANSQSNLATVYRMLGEYKRARDLLELALKSDILNFGNQHPKVAIRKNNLATAYYYLGDYKKARDLFLKAYNIFLKSLGEQHPNTQTVKGSLDSLKKK